MEGPGVPQPKRRAGDSNTPYNTSPLKEWQQNTWYGPAPIDSNPFEEPDNAPELLEERSDNLRDKSGEFWQEKPPEGYTPPAGGRKRRTSAAKKKKRKKPGTVTTAALILVGMAMLASIILYFFVFRVTKIVVVGNQILTVSEIISFSGIKKGDSILTLSEEETAKNIANKAGTAGKIALDKGEYPYEYYLQFRYLEKEMPGTVTIAVKERVPCCWTRLYGITYLMDKHRMVLYESEDEIAFPELVEVQGLDVRSGNRAGQTLQLRSAAQEEVFLELFVEMRVLNCTDRIGEADLRDTGNILLKTKDGYTVSLGDGSRIHAKLRSMLAVCDAVNDMVQSGQAKPGGTINVITPESPYYSPPAS